MNLLQKYMQLLYEVEDTVFLELANTPFSHKIKFTEEEMKELRAMEEKIRQLSLLK